MIFALTSEALVHPIPEKDTLKRSQRLSEDKALGDKNILS